VSLSPEIDIIAGADGVHLPEGRVAAPQGPGECDPAGVGEQDTFTEGSPGTWETPSPPRQIPAGDTG
jgi:hypothetical protein